MEAKGGISMPASDYFAVKAMSASGLKHLARSAAHYAEYVKNPPETTPNMAFGTAVHTAVLEPKEFFERYTVGPSQEDYPGCLVTADDLKGRLTDLGVGGLSKCKKGDLIAILQEKDPKAIIWDVILAEHEKIAQGKIVLSKADMARIEGVRLAISNHPIASKLLSQGKIEQSFFWKCKHTGLDCKARADLVRDDIGLVVDLKTAEDASLLGFERAVDRFKYDLQSAWYLDGISQATGKEYKDFVHLVVESEAPFGVAVYTLDDLSLDFARRDIAELMKKYAECVALDSWTSYPTDIQNITSKRARFGSF